MANSRITPKERGLLKGAIRRVFSRSDLRKEVVQESRVVHFDPNRKRVTKWSLCNQCAQLIPTYLAEIDHKLPIIPIMSSLDQMTWDEVIDRTWCEKSNLNAICKPCHKLKSREEMKLRALVKKERRRKAA